MERFGAKNTKATQAASKKKMIARLKSSRQVLPRRPRGISFRFPAPPHAGRWLVSLTDVSFGYSADDIFRHAALEIARGDKVAIVGANGAGKTTLLRLLAGQLEPRSGERRVFEQARMGYFAQHAAETLAPKATVLEALEEKAGPAWIAPPAHPARQLPLFGRRRLQAVPRPLRRRAAAGGASPGCCSSRRT